jgi:L-threonylcarbamoyladenylate synthase
MKLLPADEAGVAASAVALQAGGLVAFPTETVYGLGADARSDLAVAKLYAAKGRPSFNPLIVHVATLEQARRVAQFDARAEELATIFWPGPLTFVLPRRAEAGISPLVSAGLPSVAIRLPAHALARQLIERAGIPIAAPSANKSGKLSPTTPAHVSAAFGEEVDYLLAGGKTSAGLESTVLDLTEDTPVLLRPGSILQEEIEEVIGVLQTHAGNGAIKSPGLLEKHYAPRAKLRINAMQPGEGEAYICFGPQLGNVLYNLSEAGDLTEAAANLFSLLHEIDRKGYSGIAIAPIPETGLGIAINDRLRRASC